MAKIWWGGFREVKNLTPLIFTSYIKESYYPAHVIWRDFNIQNIYSHHNVDAAVITWNDNCSYTDIFPLRLGFAYRSLPHRSVRVGNRVFWNTPSGYRRSACLAWDSSGNHSFIRLCICHQRLETPLHCHWSSWDFTCGWLPVSKKGFCFLRPA